jgi:hypothetical protein
LTPWSLDPVFFYYFFFYLILQISRLCPKRMMVHCKSFEENDWPPIIPIWLFRIISIPSKFCYFRLPDHMISMELLALNFRCQCQKLQSICAVLMFDPCIKKIFTFSIKDRYQLNYFYLYQRLQCRDKCFLKIKFVFFLYLRLSASSKESDLPLCIYFWYQTDSGVPNTSIYSAVSLASPYYNYL